MGRWIYRSAAVGGDEKREDHAEANMAAASTAAAAAAARSISQLVVSELHSDYDAVDAAADEAEAAAAVAEFAATMPIVPRVPEAPAREQARLLHAPHGETTNAEIRAIDARLPVCADITQRADGALRALRTESHEADERFAQEKEKFIRASIEGFMHLREAYRECQQGRASLKMASKLIEPSVAKAQLVEHELLERRQQLVLGLGGGEDDGEHTDTKRTDADGAQPLDSAMTDLKTAAGDELVTAVSSVDNAPASLKRKRSQDSDMQAADTESARAALSERSTNAGEAASEAGGGGKRPRRRSLSWSRNSSGRAVDAAASGNGRSASAARADEGETCVLQ